MQVDIYTDGACQVSTGKGGWAWWIDDVVCQSGYEYPTTNNRMELTAVISGVAAARTLYPHRRICVYSDSQYVVLGMNSWHQAWVRKGWKTATGADVLNRDLWEQLLALTKDLDVEFKWVKGHNGHPQNERVDAMATQAIKEAE